MKVETDCWDCRGGRGQAAVGHEPERMAAETLEERERFQQKSTHERKEWQLKPPRREKKDYSGWASTSTKRLVVENQPARKAGSWNPQGEIKKITADEPQPAQKVGSWNPRGERKKITANVPSTAQRLTEQKTIPQSINDNLISKYYSLLCKFWYNM